MAGSPSPLSTQSMAPVLQNGTRGEGGAVAADGDERARQSKLRRLRQIDNLGHIGEVVARKGDAVRLPLRDHAVIGGVALDLQIDESGRIPRATGGLRHVLEAQRLEPQKNVRVKQWAGMNEENFHRHPAGID